MAAVYNCGPVPQLQTQLLLYLMAHFDDYPASSLRLLPARLRQNVLLNLPVADICKLERTKFVKGIDMESFWSTITELRLPKELKTLKISPFAKFAHSTKEFYMEVLALVILNCIVVTSEGHRSHYHLALDLMFSVKNCLGIYHWRKFLRDNPHWALYFRPGLHTTPDDTVLPSQRYLTYYSRGVSDGDLIHLLINRCDYCPTQVNVFSGQFIRSAIWNERQYPTVLAKVRDFTKNAQLLWFGAKDDSNSEELKDSMAAIFFVAREMLAVNSPTLRYVFLQAPTARSLEAHTRCIAPLFSHDEVLPATTNQRPYTQLKGLSLVVCESCHCPAPVLEKAASIIQTQTSLEEIVLSGLDLNLRSSNLRMMIAALTKHLARHSFSVLYLSNMSIPFSIMQLLTSAFFSADPMRKQSCLFNHIKIEDTDRPSVCGMAFHSNNFVMPNASLAFKRFKIYHTRLSSPVLRWLFHPQHQYKLHVLDIHAVDVDTPGTSILTVLARHPHLIVENLYLSSLELPRTAYSGEDFRYLLLKENLKVLSICDCRLGPSGLLQDLTYALMNQHVSPSFEFLALLNNSIGSQAHTVVQLFFGALFALPHLPRLSVDLRGNKFQSYHFTMLFSAWKKYSCKRKLRTLHCSNNSPPTNTVDLGKVAQTVYV